MIDVIYTLVNASKFKDDFELRYSLRSLSNQLWVNNVYLIGHCPKWAKNIIHIDCPDYYHRSKDANIINKILRACCIDDISDKFLVCSDDQYILKRVNLKQFGPWLENPCLYEKAVQKRFSSSWARRLMDTVTWCKNHDIDPKVLQSHIPYIVDKKDYPLIMTSLPWGHDNGYVTHIYQAIKHRNDIIEKEPFDMTIRLKLEFDSLHEIDKRVGDAIFLNHNDPPLNKYLMQWLDNKFPIKSRWEI